jgi:hypothetical protein
MSDPKFRREFTVERSSVDADTGTFRAVLFTDGEASDGHILHIPGGEVPARMPLFVNHESDPRSQVGSLVPGERDGHQIEVNGQIEMGLEGSQGEVARNLLRMMDAGHVSRMSGRWDFSPGDARRRTDLAKDHPHHVGKGDEGRKRHGLLFEKWQAMEGSVVGLGADPAATLRSMAETVAPKPLEPDEPEVETPPTEPEAEPELPLDDAPPAPPVAESRLNRLEAAVSAIEDIVAEMIHERAVPAVETPGPVVPAPERTEPVAPVLSIVEELRGVLAEHESKAAEQREALIRQATGRR